MSSISKALERLKAEGNAKNREGMARYGIATGNAIGVTVPRIRAIAREVGKNHALALDLWESGIHEARILASMVDLPGEVSDAQMEDWVRDFDSWDVCDQCCSNLFDKTPFAYDKAVLWSSSREEFVKRAGFVLIACLAVHDKKAPDDEFLKFLPLIRKQSADERNFVKKAVNWSLRQIGKRNRTLNSAAIETAEEIQRTESKASKWVSSDALRELKSPSVRRKLAKSRPV